MKFSFSFRFVRQTDSSLQEPSENIITATSKYTSLDEKIMCGKVKFQAKF